MRKYAREVVFCLTYEYLFTNNINDLQLDLFHRKDLTADDVDYIKNTYSGIIEHFENLSETAAKYSKGFKADRIYKVDLAILILAIYELSHTEIPTEICINEAVELAKKFSTDKSVGFVNGILAQVCKK